MTLDDTEATMNLNDPIGPQGVAAMEKLHYDGFTPDDTLADVLASSVAAQIQPQLDELCDDQWALLDAVGGTEEAINPAFEELRGFLQPAIQQAIAEWHAHREGVRPVMIATGSPADGFELIGPVIPNTPDIDEYVEIGLRHSEWWYLPVISLAAARSEEGLDK